MPFAISEFKHFTPVICVSASRYTSGGSAERLGSFNYVPGSGDDHESWAPRGFGPNLYWANEKRILAANRARLPDLLDELVANDLEWTSNTDERLTFRVGKTLIGFNTWPCEQKEMLRIKVGGEQTDTSQRVGTIKFTVLASPKKYLRAFVEQLPAVAASLQVAMKRQVQVSVDFEANSPSNVHDVAVGIALIALGRSFSLSCPGQCLEADLHSVLYYDDSQQQLSDQTSHAISEQTSLASQLY